MAISSARGPGESPTKSVANRALEGPSVTAPAVPRRQTLKYDVVMNIVLIGYRASGKSTVGRLVADRLNLKFVDIDHLIMARYDGKSVAQIWQEFGEPHYRETECDVTEESCEKDDLVIALGGGTPMQARAFQAIESAQQTVRFFLRAPAEELYRRSQIDTPNTANRPQFAAERSGLEEVQYMLSKREPTYLKLADHVIDVESMTFDDTANAVIELAVGTR